MRLVLSALSLEHVRIRVAAVIDGSPTDPTVDTVEMAFIEGADPPEAGDWKAASWETDTTTSPPTYFARCLVGPGGTVALGEGQYQTWIRVTDTPEVPIREVGKVVVT